MKKFWGLYVSLVLCFLCGVVCGMFIYAKIVTHQNAQAMLSKDGTVLCLDGNIPDADGCCAGEEYTYIIDSDMWACCPKTGDCFFPLKTDSDAKK